MSVDPIALGILGGAGVMAVIITWGAARLVRARWSGHPLLAGIIITAVAPLSTLALGSRASVWTWRPIRDRTCRRWVWPAPC